MITLNQDFKEFLKLLNKHNVKYLLIGGYAVIYYGYVRYTGDIDIFISNDDMNVDNIIAALKEFGFNLPELPNEHLFEQGKVIRLGRLPNRIQILNKISGVTFEECYHNRITELYDNIPINIISLKHLKINKKESGRHKDLDDLEHLP